MSSARVTRREAVPGDRSFVDSMLRTDALETLGDIPDPLRSELAQMMVSARTAGYLRDWPDAVEWIVEVDGAPAGRLLLAWVPTGLRIVDVRLLARWRGRGVGTAVLTALTAEADQDRWPVCLSVDPASPARHLYERAGFVRTSGAPEHADVVLRLERPVTTGG